MRKACSIIGALFISLFIYVFYRSDRTLINEFVKLLFSMDRYADMKRIIVSILSLHDIIIFSLPGGLWIFCATVLAQGFYLQINKYRVQLVFIPILFALGLEIFQLVHITNGRFDPWDIVFYLMFWLPAYYGFQPKELQQNIISPFTLKGFLCLACFFSVYLAHVNP